MNKISNENISLLLNKNARLWKFSASHDQLIYMITGEGHEPKFLVLLCCDEIKTPIFWKIKKPVIKKASNPFYLLSDEDDVSILFEEAFLVKEDELPFK